MIKIHYPIFAILAIFLLGSTFYFLQANAQDEKKGVFVSKILTDHLEPGVASASILICADDVPLSHPEIVVTSDVESRILTFNGNVQENLCRGETVLIRANNLSSISAYSTNFSNPLFIDGFLSSSQQDITPISITQNVLNTPIWFSNTMNWYLDGKISEKELTLAAEYLIEEKIILFI